MSLRKPLAIILVAVLAAAILFLVASLRYENGRQTRSTGESSPPTISSFEKDGETIDEFPVGDSVLQIPRNYVVRYTTPNGLNLVTFWPDLASGWGSEGLETTDRINLIFKPMTRILKDRDRANMAKRHIESLQLVGPEWSEELQLDIYRDDQGRLRFLLSKEDPAPARDVYSIFCIPSERPISPECRWSYELTDDLQLEVRFYVQRIEHWKDLNWKTRQFALALVRGT